METIRKSCKRVRDKSSMSEEEKKIYNYSLFNIDTSYCHHYNMNGEHIVLHGFETEESCKCCGIFYYNVLKQQLKCKDARNENLIEGGHDLCNKENCPYMRDSGKCPYMP